MIDVVLHLFLNFNIKFIFSGNLFGDVGARMISKALLINTRLKKVVWDRNNISAIGYEDIAEALTKLVFTY